MFVVGTIALLSISIGFMSIASCGHLKKTQVCGCGRLF